MKAGLSATWQPFEKKNLTSQLVAWAHFQAITSQPVTLCAPGAAVMDTAQPIRSASVDDCMKRIPRIPIYALSI